MSKIKYLLLIIPFLFLSCVDEDELLGKDMVDPSDEIAVKKYSNFDINAYIYHEGDSLKTSGYRYMTLGTYKDNYFGRVQSSIYTQISLSSTSMDFNSFKQGGSQEADSIVLALAYNGFFSKDTLTTEKEMLLEIYEITQLFEDSASYYSNSTLTYNSAQPIFSGNVLISPKENVIIGSDTLSPQLRINLGEEFLNKIVSSGSFSSNSDFLNYFKGFYIRLSVLSNDFIAYFDMYSSLSAMMIYYQDQNNRTQKYNFVFDQSTSRFTHIDYDFSSTPLDKFQTINSPEQDSISCNNSLGNDSKIFLGTLGISRAKIDIKDLKQWYEDSTENLGMFNQAMLILPVADNYLEEAGGEKNIPQRIICYAKNNEGQYVYIDDAYTSESYMGTYDKSINAYKMRITSHLQNYLNGTLNNGEIYLFADSKTSTANRVVLNGPKAENRPIRIEIIYTK
ncbi:MAG: DUF4270 domain-containing protein [Bacteroidales bacterium]|jgi:hypothetical protein|nr:DUF4270 domain-containing protein [Bacteroidales bacterium]